MSDPEEQVGIDCFGSIAWLGRVRHRRASEEERTMSTTGLKSFDSTVQLTNAWLNELAEEMGWRDHSAFP